MELPNVPVHLASPELIAERKILVTVTNVPMVALVLKRTEPRHVTVLKASQASIVERKMLLRDNVVAEDLGVPVRKACNVLAKFKRLVAKEHVANQAIIALTGYPLSNA